MGWANREVHTKAEISQRAKARSKLKRHGWNYKNKCRLSDVARDCLLPTPQFPKTPFAGLLHYERMHTFFINYCTYLLEILSALVPKAKYNAVNEIVRRCHVFRDPVSGRTHPRLKSILKMTHLTAERRVRAIFYWSHVLGTRAECIPTPMKMHAQVAVSTLQLILIAVRGHRAYTRAELDTIFIEVGSEFFKSLEIMSQFLDEKRMQNGHVAHARNPANTRPPVPFKRQRRCVYLNQFVPLSTNLSHCQQFVPLSTYLSLWKQICLSVTKFVSR